MTSNEDKVLGYTPEEFADILRTIEPKLNFYQFMDWLEKNAPDKTNVNERTVRCLIENYKFWDE